MVAINKPTVGGSVGTWGTELNTALDTLAGAINTGGGGGGGGGGSVFLSTLADGIDNTGTADITTTLQDLIDTSPTGATIFFDPGVYLITRPIVLQPGRSYIGGGQNTSSGATIKLADTTNITAPGGLTGLFVAAAWNSDQTQCDPGLLISNLAFNGNRAMNGASTACGIVLTNFWARIENCYLYDIPKHAILLTDQTRNGTNVVTNSCSENRIYNLKINDCLDAIHQVSANGNSNMDGFLADCLISTVRGTAISMQRAAGWTIRSNHLYGIGDNAIDLTACFATTVASNYIEDFGGNNTAGAYYSGISVSQLNGRGSTVYGNHVSCAEPAVNASHYQLLRLNAAFGQTDAHIVAIGNTVKGDGTSAGTGILMEHTTGGILSGVVAGNRIDTCNTPYYSDGIDSGEFQALGVTTHVGTVYNDALTWQRARIQTDGAPAGVVTVGAAFQTAATVNWPLYVNDLCGSITTTAKAAPVAGAMATYTFAQQYDQSPRCISLTPTNAAAANARIYISAQDRTAFTVSCATAPTASQVLTFNYQILA